MDSVGLGVIYALLAATFLLPLFAKTWKGLLILGLISCVPALCIGVVMIQAEADILFLAVIGFGIAPGVGIGARVGSLYAQNLGHKRPASLWIEGAVVAGCLLLVLS